MIPNIPNYVFKGADLISYAISKGTDIANSVSDRVGKIYSSIKEFSIRDVLVQEPDQSLYDLEKLFPILIETPENCDESILEQFYLCLDDVAENAKYLKQLNKKELQTCKKLFSLFFSPIRSTEEGELDLEQYRQLLKEGTTKNLLSQCQTTLSKLLEKNRGWIVAIGDVVQAKGTKILAAANQQLTSVASPQLLDSYNSCVQLQEAISCKSLSNIRSFSQALENHLNGLLSISPNMAVEDQLILRELHRRLPGFYGINPISYEEMLMLIENAKPSIDRYYHSESGLVQKVVNTATKPVLDQVGRLARTNVENVIDMFHSPNSPPILPPSPINTSSTENASSPPLLQNSASGFLNYCSSLLQSVGGFVSKTALGPIIEIFGMGIAQIMQKIDPADESSKQILNNLLSTLEKAKAEGNWAGLNHAFTEAARTLNHLNICVSGFNLPKLLTSSQEMKDTEGVLLENMQMLGEEQNTPKPPSQEQDWTRLALEEKGVFVYNMTYFLGMKRIFQSISHVTPSPTLYLELLHKAKIKDINDPNKIDIKASEQNLKKLVFEELNKQNIGFFRKTWAKLSYYFFTFFVREKIEKAATIYLNDTFKLIDDQGKQPEGFKPLQKQIIERLSGFFSILGGAYERVASDGTRPGRVVDILKSELEKKESNGGFDITLLYQELIDDARKKASLWSISIWVIKKFLGNPSDIVRDVVDNATHSFSDGCTYALNCVIEEQLDEILHLLQEHFAKKNTPGSDLNDDNVRVTREMQELVKNIFAVLPQIKCDTVKELRATLDTHSIGSQMQEFINGKSSKILEQIAASLTLAVQSLTKPNRLQELTYKFASLANKSFAINEPITDEQMREKEQRINKRCEQILQLAISTAVENTLDISGGIEQNKTNYFIKQLHERSQAYFKGKEQEQGAGRCLKDLSKINLRFITDQNATEPDRNVTKVALKNCIEQIKEQTKAYEQFCFDFQSQARNSSISTANKTEVNNRYFSMAEHSQSYLRAIKEIEEQTHLLCNKDDAIAQMKEIRKVPSTIHQKLFSENGLSLENTVWGGKEIEHLENLIHTLKQSIHGHPILSILTQQKQNLAHNLARIEKAIQVRTLENISIDEMANLAQACLEQGKTDPQLTQKLGTFKQQLERTLDPGPLLKKLITQIDLFSTAGLPQMIHTAQNTCKELLQSLFQEATNNIQDCQNRSQECMNTIERAIDTSSLLDPKIKIKTARALRRANRVAKNALKELRRWEEKNIKPVAYANFPIQQMKGLQDLACGLIQDQVRGHVDNLIELFRQPLMYYGAARHLALIPYAKSLKSQK